jgi:hypothetical protein
MQQLETNMSAKERDARRETVRRLNNKDNADTVAKQKRDVANYVATNKTLAEACMLAGCKVMDVIAWRRNDTEFSALFRDACTAAMTSGDELDTLVAAAYLTATRGNASMIQFMLMAVNPTVYCPKIRTLAYIDEQARSAAKLAAQGGTSDSAAIILAHLNKLAAEKAGIASAASE